MPYCLEQMCVARRFSFYSEILTCIREEFSDRCFSIFFDKFSKPRLTQIKRKSSIDKSDRVLFFGDVLLWEDVHEQDDVIQLHCNHFEIEHLRLSLNVYVVHQHVQRIPWNKTNEKEDEGNYLTRGLFVVFTCNRSNGNPQYSRS